MMNRNDEEKPDLQGSASGCSSDSILDYYTMYITFVPTFRRNTLLPPSG